VRRQDLLMTKRRVAVHDVEEARESSAGQVVGDPAQR
jgi:hypothetical protein